MARRLGVLTGAIVTVVSVSWLVVVIGTAASDADHQPIGATPTTVSASRSSTPNDLTAEQAEAAKAIALGDDLVRSRVGSQTPTIGRVMAWSNNDGEIIGAAVELRLDVPIHLDAGLPVVKPGLPADGVGLSDFIADDVTRLYAVVDLASGRVVGLQPGPGARLTNLPGVTIDRGED